jgi:hypothetical protein
MQEWADYLDAHEGSDGLRPIVYVDRDDDNSQCNPAAEPPPVRVRNAFIFIREIEVPASAAEHNEPGKNVLCDVSESQLSQWPVAD